MPREPAPVVDDTLRAVMRSEWPRIVARLMRDLGDLGIAEDATQEAMTEALVQWPVSGIPDVPGAWLMTVARRRAIDRIRRDHRRTEKETLAARLEAPRHAIGRTPTARMTNHDETGLAAIGDGADDPDDPDEGVGGINDDQLVLLYVCCHPALAPDAQVALVMRSVAGLTTSEIARAFLVSEATMAQRIVRAKRKIRNAGIPFRLPGEDLTHERTEAVLSVIYLVFNEGYAATSGESLVRADLCAEAVRLARLVSRLRPDDPECAGLLALILFTDARRDARLDAEGELVLLEHQDRSRWDRTAIGEGIDALARFPIDATSGPYRLQGEIARKHAQATTAADTDWPNIVSLYDALAIVNASPVVELNRAVAVAMADDPIVGLDIVEAIGATGALEDYYLFHAARADLLRRVGRLDAARDSYLRAIDLTGTEAERRFLERRVAHIDAPTDSSLPLT